MSEAILEEMRERLEQKGAFDQFKKKKDDEFVSEVEMKTIQLKTNLFKREEMKEKTEWCNLIHIDKPLTFEEADAVELTFTRKNITNLIETNGLPIDVNLRKDELLVEMSKLGYHLRRYNVVKCKKCGTKSTEINFRLALIDEFYCKECQKEKDELNKTQTQMPLFKKP